MPCYHPKYGYLEEVSTGLFGMYPGAKRKLRFCSEKIYKEVMQSGNEYEKSRYISVPCGKCQGCLDDRARNWANRLLMESKYYSDNEVWFVTLTYNNENLPLKPNVDLVTGEIVGEVATLEKDAPSKFMKRLRNYFPDNNLRFFCCGEYGGHTKRPHYHLIIFGMPLDREDLTFYKKTDLGFNLYNCDKVSRAWTKEVKIPRCKPLYEPLGYVVIAKASWETMAYTARYVAKKAYEDDMQYWIDHDIQPEFNVMSRRPGIAWQYYQDNPNILDYDKISIATPYGGKMFKPPKYFERLLECEDKYEAFERSINKREKAFDYRLSVERNNHKDYQEYLAGVELNHKKALDVLKYYRNEL